MANALSQHHDRRCPAPPRSTRRKVHAREVRATIARAALLIVFAVLAVAAMFYSVVEAADAYTLAQHYRAVEGTVTQTQCASHLQVDYAFDAGGVSHRGSGIAHKRCDAYRIGDAIAVYYEPENPMHSLNEVPPQQQWHTRLALLATEIAVLAVVALLIRLRQPPRW